MTQATLSPLVTMAAEDILWIRFRAVALLQAAHSLASSEQWQPAYVLTGDAYTFFDLCKTAEIGKLHPSMISRARLSVWSGREAELAALPACGRAYADILKTLGRYGRRDAA